MTEPRKRAVKVKRRVPSYVDRRTGAAELSISISCWRGWVRDGILPPPAPGFPPSNLRWKWSTVVAWLDGDRSEIPAAQNDFFAEGGPLLGRHRKRGPPPGTGGRPRTASAQMAPPGTLTPLTEDDLADLSQPETPNG